jgi:hypothetical protein
MGYHLAWNFHSLELAVTLGCSLFLQSPNHSLITAPSPQDDAVVAAIQDDTSAVAITISAPRDNSLPTAVPPSRGDLSTSSSLLDGIDDSWPSWFKNGFVPLKGAKLGEKWESLLAKYVSIEAWAGFISPKGAAHAFGVDKHPAEVEWWIACARKPKPVVKDVMKLQDSFWAWWKGLQPQWREASKVDSPLMNAHRYPQRGDSGWKVLDKPGQNGFLTVVSLLCWWGQALCNGNIEMTGWHVANVEWVLTQMLSGQE